MIASQREARKAEKAQRAVEAKDAKEKIVAEAEKIAEGNDWRAGANRLRALLDEWKALPRIDRASDDALWRRFSSRADDVHPAPQGALRRAEREARGRPRWSRSDWRRRPRRSPTRPTGARPRAATAT